MHQRRNVKSERLLYAPKGVQPIQGKNAKFAIINGDCPIVKSFVNIGSITFFEYKNFLHRFSEDLCNF